MPELPEVETIARALRNGGRDGEPISGNTIRGVRLLWERTLATPDRITFNSRLLGQRIVDVTRRGKFLIIILNQDTLLVHLRMSGDIRVEKAFSKDGLEAPPLTHDRLIIDFDKNGPEGLRMAFNDPRKFGRVWLVRDLAEVLGNLGPEPLADDFLAVHFFQSLHALKRTIKPLLMDQSFLAGLGNIYTDEALYLAGIHPLRSSASISAEESEGLWNSIRFVLNEGIRRNGASIDWVYRGGDFQNTFHVYQRTGEPCLRCGAEITRIVIGQRGTHFCPSCQPMHPSNS